MTQHVCGRTLSSTQANVGGKLLYSETTKNEGERISAIKGQKESHLQFGSVQGCLKSLLEILGHPQIWILIDEWSEVPLDLQPYLADLLRKTLLPIDNFVIKIAAIEHRTRFYESKGHGEYIGLELGADISADLNLDDFLVFDNDQKKSVEFFKSLLFRHLSTSTSKLLDLNPDDFIKITFTQTPVFEEFVRAAEGVPRDALNLAAKMASKAYGKTIAMADVRTAARDWYQSDKAAAVQANQSLAPILGHIVDTVIGKRRARAFLFPANMRNEHIERLFDARILHLRKRNISSNDAPGKRYDAYKIDYGCYVDLINTQKSTQGFFEVDDGGFVEVPADDYRSIRRAILKPEDLENFAQSEDS